METDQIERLLAHDPLMCLYTVTAEIVETYPFALVCNTHNADQPGEHWVAVYVDEECGDYFDPYGQPPQHIEFTNFMNEHCSEGCLTSVYCRALYLPFAVSTASLS